MFIDATAMAAMMTDEDEARSFARRMQPSTARLTSPMAVTKTISTVSVTLGLALGETAEAVKAFLRIMNIQVLAVPPKAGFLAVEAEESFGLGRHPANLNAEECMIYACARYYRQPLLFKDGGFGATDLELA